jgi:hypothetical protein
MLCLRRLEKIIVERGWECSRASELWYPPETSWARGFCFTLESLRRKLLSLTYPVLLKELGLTPEDTYE